jgi:Protein of unknown function (DUF1501)
MGHEARSPRRGPWRIRDRDGWHAHGQSVLQARRLVEAGVPLVTVFWPNEGLTNVSIYWDTHNRNFIDLKTRLIPPADQAFSALLDDLSGILERLGTSAETWHARLEKLKSGRLLGRFFAANRERLREVAAHLRVHHLANLAGCPAR